MENAQLPRQAAHVPSEPILPLLIVSKHVRHIQLLPLLCIVDVMQQVHLSLGSGSEKYSGESGELRMDYPMDKRDCMMQTRTHQVDILSTVESLPAPEASSAIRANISAERKSAPIKKPFHPYLTTASSLNVPVNMAAMKASI